MFISFFILSSASQNWSVFAKFSDLTTIFTKTVKSADDELVSEHATSAIKRGKSHVSQI